MSNEMTVADQIEIVRGLLTQTQTGKVHWEPTGESGTYRSVRARAAVVMDTVGSRPARVRLRFSPAGRVEFDTRIEQVLAEAEPFDDEQELDAFLSVLYQLVDSRLARPRTSAEAFLESD